MGDNLVIVESPAKAKTIEKFLGKDFTVKSSFGHIRDLSKKNLGIDINNGFEPNYVVSTDKKKVISELKAAVKKSKTVWLASDEDREGEAIAWHLFETLELKPENTKRIVFNEITKTAITKAIQNPREVDMNLVMAQQARRVLDRLVGFELSPILWRKIKPSLSAGRVQSAALRLIVDREREIIAFDSSFSYKVEGIFIPDTASGNTKVRGILDTKFATHQEAEDFLNKCATSSFKINSIEKKEQTRKPSPPFTTSSLQQEASRKFGFSVSQTMSIAQKLYESGFITYMRTDSTNLSDLAIGAAKECIMNLYGPEYSQVRKYKTKAKGAQEAHEAIRPTYMEKPSIEGASAEKKLYELIWKRTIASQMSDAKLEKTTIAIGGSNISEIFNASGLEILFSGFLKLYIESSDDEQEMDDTILPELKEGIAMENQEITAAQKYTLHPPRYTEASLVKKMEELGIGRPSTYAPTISTVSQRGYIVKRSQPGEKKDIDTLMLAGGSITKSIKKEVIGSEKNKLFPEDIGIVVIDFLSENFPNILDYKFTARVEENFDSIAEGEQKWNETISSFYKPFHEKVESTMTDTTHQRTEKELGVDPKTGKKITARMGKFGPLVQLGENDDPDKKFASITKGHLIETLTLEDALKLFELPRSLGEYDGKEITCAIGRFGPYVKYNSAFVSLPKGSDPYSFSYDEAVELIKAKAEADKKANIMEFPEHEIQVLNGRFGPYIKHKKKNHKLPKGTIAEELTLEQCLEIIKG